MSKEIGRLSGQGQVIVKDGKFWGYPPDEEFVDTVMFTDRAWRDNAVDAIIWKTELDDITKIYCPSDMSLEGSELKKITKTIIVTEDE